MRDRLGALRSEQAVLRELIANSDPDDVSRISFEARLNEVTEQLAGAEREDETLGHATLLFRGAPVNGTQGIDARFAGKVVEKFQDLVARVAAARSGRKLHGSGPIPGASENRLFVTATASGSFGLVLREIDRAQLVPSPLSEAIEATTELLARAGASDDEFADAAVETDATVLDELDRFLGVVADHGATMKVVSRRAIAALDDPEVLAAARERTHGRSDDELSSPVTGVLEGVLPTARRFELVEHPSGALVSGRLGPSIDPAVAQALVGQQVRALLRVLVIRSRGRETSRSILESVEPLTQS
jgi:hypothetical protein